MVQSLLMNRYIVSFAIAMFISIGQVYACDQKNVPIELLGKNAFNGELDFRSYLSVVELSSDSESASVSDSQHWFALDKNRNYFTFQIDDGIVKSLIIEDKCLKNNAGLKVGDTLSEVIFLYPNAKFKMGGDKPRDGIFDLLIDKGRVEIIFNSQQVQKKRTAGYKVNLKDEMIQSLRIMAVIYR
jgi:hypothetical protein